jgi:hypothetical protein
MQAAIFAGLLSQPNVVDFNGCNRDEKGRKRHLRTIHQSGLNVR